MHCIEESNILVYTEGIKCFTNMIKMLKSNIPFTFLRHFLLTTCEKYKAPKQKGYNQNIDNVLDEIVKSDCFTPESFIELLLHMSENEKNLHMRIGVIVWFSKIH